jgi:hypothetical protein
MTFPLSKIWVNPNLLTHYYHHQCSTARSNWTIIPDGRTAARGKIAQLIENHESSLEDNPTRIKFTEEIITYNKMLEFINNNEKADIMWKF